MAARLWERLGDLPRALAATKRRRLTTSPWRFHSTYLRERGRIAAATGDRETAIDAYRQYIAMRSAAEPALQPDLASAKRELDRLLKNASGR